MIPRRAEATRVLAGALLAGGAADWPGPRLVAVTGPARGARLPLRHGAVLGRSRRAELRLGDPAASRLHLRFTIGDSGAAVEDMGSRNGATINGFPLAPGAAPLAAGDEIGVGESILRVEGLEEDAGDLDPSPSPPLLRPPPGSSPRPARPRGLAAALAASGALIAAAVALALAAG
jgi:predicted component of type VI protein secretion system